jgi:hypothetical protein
MIRTQLAEDDVEGNGPGVLTCHFLKQAAIDLARPVQAEVVSERAVPNALKAIFVDKNEPQIGGDGRSKLERLANAHVISHPLEPFEKIKAKQAKDAGEGNDT